MSEYPTGIFTKKKEFRKTYEKEIGVLDNVDKDEEIKKDIAKLEELVTYVVRGAHRCDIMGEFLNNIETIGEFRNKYTVYRPLPEESESYRKFHDALRRSNLAKGVFVRDCDCKYRKKLYYQTR